MAGLTSVLLPVVTAATVAFLLNPDYINTMATLEAWKTALIVIASIVSFFYILWRLLLLYAPRAYNALVLDNAKNVDEFVCCDDLPPPKSCLKVLVLHYFNCGTREVREEPYELKAEESVKVPGLMVTTRSDAKVKEAEVEMVATRNDAKVEEAKEKKEKKTKAPLVVGTIRMGFGHHRIAYAATSWGIDSDPERETYFHDLINIESEEATMIKDTDAMYSKGSRLASELGGPVEALWGSLTKSGDEDSLRVTYQFAEHMKPIVAGLDKDSPIIASHSMVAAAAVAAGFTNVINLVIDNHAQWFVVVPGALNLVQGPANYYNFLKMGVKPEYLGLAGHWIPRDLVEGIPAHTKHRIARVKSRGGWDDEGGKPIRILIPVGGAGAQRKFIVNLVQALVKRVESGQVQLFLNAGDHPHMKKAFRDTLHNTGIDYDTVTDMAGVRSFREKLLDGKSEPTKAVTLFAFDDYFTAVATTDLLCPVADVLACKPSELAFYPIPKLMIRRVGDHEAYSAIRANELGDGTLEARTIEMVLRYVEVFFETEMLVTMNESIVANNKIGLYDGCKNAVKIALERAM